jgi:hypothetical protein
MRMKRRSLSAECEHCGGRRSRTAFLPYDVMRQQLETCRDSIEAALEHLPESPCVTSDGVMDDDIFSYGPQGSD